METVQQADGSFAVIATLLYGQSLFKAQFTLEASRTLQMVDSKPIAADLPVVRLLFDNGWALWSGSRASD